MDNCFLFLGDKSISLELLEAFDTLLSAVAVHSQAGKDAVEKAGGIDLTRLKSIVITGIKYCVNSTRIFRIIK